MPTDLPDRAPPRDREGRAFSGRLVVIAIVAWTMILLILASAAIHRLKSDPCWDRGPAGPAPPACTPR